jgi:hypothetical protein
VLYPCWLALSFCHCKNVTVSTRQPLKKGKPERYRGIPRATYHTLEIQPMRTILRTEGHSDTEGLRQALHICRGHFKDYSRGKGLFGRLPGLYWWESHVRGSAESGLVRKEYAVAAPGTPQEDAL